MGRTQEPTGDYGYDLAHQDVPPAGARADAGTSDQPATPSGQEDTAGDYGYDEAHGF